MLQALRVRQMLVKLTPFLLYLLRWQMSTPILYGVLYFLGSSLEATIAANFIGGCLFFFVDKQIFKPRRNHHVG